MWHLQDADMTCQLWPPATNCLHHSCPCRDQVSNLSWMQNRVSAKNKKTFYGNSEWTSNVGLRGGRIRQLALRRVFSKMRRGWIHRRNISCPRSEKIRRMWNKKNIGPSILTHSRDITTEPIGHFSHGISSHLAHTAYNQATYASITLLLEIFSLLECIADHTWH